MDTPMSRRDLLEIYTSNTPTIAPSMLGCDFGNLHREVELLESAGATDPSSSKDSDTSLNSHSMPT